MTTDKVLLLTDVVDSTQLIEQLGDEAAAVLWRDHDRAARSLLPVWRGLEIDKTDGMLLLFDAVGDAVGFAAAYHDALAGLSVPLKARAGLHRGPVLLRRNDPEDVARGAKPLEVEGLAKPMAARVMSLARAGQTLLTHDAVEALAGGDAAVSSCGHWVFKGISEPVEVFQLARDGVPAASPVDTDKVHQVVREGERWIPVREIPNNLPHSATSFVGRHRELAELRRLLGSARLVTLLGMGGLGKTRLSLQLAQESRPEHPDGLWFVDLSALRDPALVPAQLAQALGVRAEPDRPVVDTLCTVLRDSRALLVFDNCEHLLDAAGDLVDRLLRTCGRLRVVASSREPLDVPGEHVYPILPLPLPRAGDDLVAGAESPAVRLFVERARAHRPDFAPVGDDVGRLVGLVIRLEGIPLAIELAAARVRTLDLAAIGDGLARRYELLTGGSRRLQARQQTLQALVDWSYDMLRPHEQAMFRQLGVCAGGFDLDAARAVCALPPMPDGATPAPGVEDVVRSLAEKSLLVPESSPDGARWRMLETLREYAADRLEQAGERADARRRHTDHYFAFAKRGKVGLQGADQGPWAARMELDLDNLRAATAAALEGDADPFVAVKLAVALQTFWILRGYVTEGRGVVAAALALPAVAASELAQAHALQVGAVLADSQSDHAQARAMLEACLALRRRVGHAIDVAATLVTLATTQRQGGDPAAARASAQEALDLFRREGHPVGEGIALQQRGLCAAALDDRARAREDLQAALDLAITVGHRDLQAECLVRLCHAELDEGAVDAAGVHAQRALDTARAGADRRNEALARSALASVALAAGDAAAAREHVAAALSAFHRFEMRDELLLALEVAARLALAVGQPDVALRTAAVVDQVRARFFLVRTPPAARAWAAWRDQVAQATAANGGDDPTPRRAWTLTEALAAAGATV